MIETHPFGRTGHESSRILFGAAAMAAMKPARGQATLELLQSYGVNHLDTAASYGDSELNIAPWLRAHRDDFFLATKTGARDGEGARRSLEASLERMGVDSVDLIQLHNLVDEDGWQTAMGPGGAVEALSRARDEGLVRFLGVTGHGTYAPEMHLRSLEQFEFASVLCPYNFSMMQVPQYARDFEALDEACRARGVALQTIKSVGSTPLAGPRGPALQLVRAPQRRVRDPARSALRARAPRCLPGTPRATAVCWRPRSGPPRSSSRAPPPTARRCRATTRRTASSRSSCATSPTASERATGSWRAARGQPPRVRGAARPRCRGVTTAALKTPPPPPECPA